jgi:hypothetical protein
LPARAGPAPAYSEQILVHIFSRGMRRQLVVPLGAADHNTTRSCAQHRHRPSQPPADRRRGSAGPWRAAAGPAASRLAHDAGRGAPDAIASRELRRGSVELNARTVGTPTGWLTGFFAMGGTLGLYPDEIFLPIIDFRNNPPASLLGNTSALTVSSPGAFKLNNAHWRWSAEDVGYMQLEMLPTIYALGNDEFSHAGSQALAAEAILRTSFDEDYSGAGSLAYGASQIGSRLSDVAQLIKLDLGARIFTLDYHNATYGQDNPQNYADLLAQLSTAWRPADDLEKRRGNYGRTTVIIQSEFGRRLYQNISNGTDHGNGNLMLVLGKQVNGGTIYGDWPGLYPGTADGFVNYPNPKNGSTAPELFQGALATTTDFRRVLSEYLEVRCQHTAPRVQSSPAIPHAIGIFSPGAGRKPVRRRIR